MVTEEKGYHIVGGVVYKICQKCIVQKSLKFNIYTVLTKFLHCILSLHLMFTWTQETNLMSLKTVSLIRWTVFFEIKYYAN